MEPSLAIIEKLKHAQEYAFTNRPKVGGFPYLAECLRMAGVTHNEWILPAGQCTYFMQDGVLVVPGKYLIDITSEVPLYNQDLFIQTLRQSQAGQIAFPEFLDLSWKAGVVRYQVDFIKRIVTYFGARGESYEESYPAMELPGLKNF